ncbi:TetR/AcrR family transcriptional regulator [Mycolicibacterium stellerae]|uniref:TetR/AcrR family transcriptional regulator n=1 Tax=Mycolicibacterium stellerae TaxID=2358193 RepID=UPI000F0B5400|nr:TetR/AcrR family transcriptional regulator [Mycolicibacterium stellerae]
MAGTRQFDTDAAVDKAMNLFWERGYEATSLQDITKALGLGRGSIYQAFGSKEGLYRAALAQYLNLMAAELVTALEQGPDLRSALKNALLGRLDAAIGGPLPRGCMLVNAACERLPHDATTRQTVTDVMAANRTALETALTRAVDLGQINPSFDPSSLAEFLVSCLSGLLVTAKVQPDRAALTRTVDIALSVLGQPQHSSATLGPQLQDPS